MSLCESCSKIEAKKDRPRTYFDSKNCQDCDKQLQEKT